MKKFSEIALRSSARRVPRPRLLWVGLAFAVVIAAVEAVIGTLARHIKTVTQKREILPDYVKAKIAANGRNGK